MNKQEKEYIKIWLVFAVSLVAIFIMSTIRFLHTERPKTQREFYMECYNKCVDRGFKSTKCLDSCVPVWRMSDTPGAKL